MATRKVDTLEKAKQLILQLSLRLDRAKTRIAELEAQLRKEK